MGEEEFGTQAGGVDAFLGEVVGGPIQQVLYCPGLHSRIIDGAEKSERQKGPGEAGGRKLGLVGFVLGGGARALVFIIPCHNCGYVHLGVGGIGFV